MQYLTQMFQVLVGLVVIAHFHVEGASSPGSRSPSKSPSRMRRSGSMTGNGNGGSGKGGRFMGRFSRSSSTAGKPKGTGIFNIGSFRSNSQGVLTGKSFKRSESWKNLQGTERSVKEFQDLIMELFSTAPSSQKMFEAFEAYQQLDNNEDGIPVETPEELFDRFQNSLKKPEGPDANMWGWKHYCTAACLNTYGYIHEHNANENELNREMLYQTVLVAVTDPKVVSASWNRMRKAFGRSAKNPYSCACNTRPDFLVLLKKHNYNTKDFAAAKKKGASEALTWLEDTLRESQKLMTVTFEMYKDYMVDSLKGLAEGSTEGIRKGMEGMATPKQRKPPVIQS